MLVIVGHGVGAWADRGATGLFGAIDKWKPVLPEEAAGLLVGNLGVEFAERFVGNLADAFA